MLQLNLSKQAFEFLDKLPAKHGKQILEKLQILCLNPELLQTEPLQGFHPFRRLRAGEYRVIYYIEANTLFIVLAGKRNDDDIYKMARRLWQR